MPKITDSLTDNPYLRNTAHTCLTLLVDETLKKLSLAESDLKYIHGLIAYAGYSKDTDIFCFI